MMGAFRQKPCSVPLSASAVSYPSYLPRNGAEQEIRRALLYVITTPGGYWGEWQASEIGWGGPLGRPGLLANAPTWPHSKPALYRIEEICSKM